MDALSAFIFIHQVRLPGTSSPSGFQMRRSKDSQGRPEYIGLAKKGTASSDSGWQIFKITYDSGSFWTLVQSSGRDAIWDNRATSVTYS